MARQRRRGRGARRTRRHRSVPEAMRAAAIDRPGGPGILKIHELPVPVPGPEKS